tara:strand:+ start:709 stop:882 length:174 start_codon:yes stop_codon:yes gene_type:complete
MNQADAKKYLIDGAKSSNSQYITFVREHVLEAFGETTTTTKPKKAKPNGDKEKDADV